MQRLRVYIKETFQKNTYPLINRDYLNCTLELIGVNSISDADDYVDKKKDTYIKSAIGFSPLSEVRKSLISLGRSVSTVARLSDPREQSPSLEDDRSLASQEIPVFYGTPKFITLFTIANQVSIS